MESRSEEHSHAGRDSAHEGVAHVHEVMSPPTLPSRSVVIDVDSTAGALVLATSANYEGTEVEIHPTLDPSSRSHVWVLPREGVGEVLYAAVFPRLACGDYTVLAQDGSVHEVLTVNPNQVTFASWMEAE
jgi:hypothetical protein